MKHCEKGVIFSKEELVVSPELRATWKFPDRTSADLAKGHLARSLKAGWF